MLTFLISLRHPETAANYARVEWLLGNTIATIDRQLDRNFHVIVVGNQLPKIDLPPCASFVVVNFPPPPHQDGAKLDRSAILLDKGTKLAVAALAGREAGATMFMVADADDYFSNRISQFVNSNPGGNGWFVDEGYIYSSRRKLIRQVRSGFNELCGSSLIFPTDLVGFPEISPSASQTDILESFGNATIGTFFGSHRHLRNWCTERNTPLSRLPFAAAVYNVDTEENAWTNTFRGTGSSVSIPVSQEFGLPVGKRIGPLKALAGSCAEEVRRTWKRLRSALP